MIGLLPPVVRLAVGRGTSAETKAEMAIAADSARFRGGRHADDAAPRLTPTILTTAANARAAAARIARFPDGSAVDAERPQ